MYKINDIVVYKRDVCRVKETVVSERTGEHCYILVPFNDESGMTKMIVPVANAGGHLRDLLTEEELEDLLSRAPAIETLADKQANMKSQYVALLRSDSLEDLICIIKTSYLRNKTRLDNHKKLAAIDGEYLQKAENYLFKEMSVAMGKSIDECRAYFANKLNRAE